jgi:hypothetical protein
MSMPNTSRRPRRAVPEALRDEAAGSAAFGALLERLGYEPVG